MYLTSVYYPSSSSQIVKKSGIYQVYDPTGEQNTAEGITVDTGYFVNLSGDRYYEYMSVSEIWVIMEANLAGSTEQSYYIMAPAMVVKQ